MEDFFWLFDDLSQYIACTSDESYCLEEARQRVGRLELAVTKLSVEQSKMCATTMITSTVSSACKDAGTMADVLGAYRRLVQRIGVIEESVDLVLRASLLLPEEKKSAQLDLKGCFSRMLYDSIPHDGVAHARRLHAKAGGDTGRFCASAVLEIESAGKLTELGLLCSPKFQVEFVAEVQFLFGEIISLFAKTSKCTQSPMTIGRIGEILLPVVCEFCDTHGLQNVPALQFLLLAGFYSVMRCTAEQTLIGINSGWYSVFTAFKRVGIDACGLREARETVTVVMCDDIMSCIIKRLNGRFIVCSSVLEALSPSIGAIPHNGLVEPSVLSTLFFAVIKTSLSSGIEDATKYCKELFWDMCNLSGRRDSNFMKFNDVSVYALSQLIICFIRRLIPYSSVDNMATLYICVMCAYISGRLSDDMHSRSFELATAFDQPVQQMYTSCMVFLLHSVKQIYESAIVDRIQCNPEVDAEWLQSSCKLEEGPCITDSLPADELMAWQVIVQMVYSLEPVLFDDSTHRINDSYRIANRLLQHDRRDTGIITIYVLSAHMIKSEAILFKFAVPSFLSTSMPPDPPAYIKKIAGVSTGHYTHTILSSGIIALVDESGTKTFCILHVDIVYCTVLMKACEPDGITHRQLCEIVERHEDPDTLIATLFAEQLLEAKKGKDGIVRYFITRGIYRTPLPRLHVPDEQARKSAAIPALASDTIVALLSRVIKAERTMLRDRLFEVVTPVLSDGRWTLPANLGEMLDSAFNFLLTRELISFEPTSGIVAYVP